MPVFKYTFAKLLTRLEQERRQMPTHLVAGFERAHQRSTYGKNHTRNFDFHLLPVADKRSVWGV